MGSRTFLIVLSAVLPSLVLLRLLAGPGRSLTALLPSMALGGLACAPALLTERLLTLQPWNVAHFGTFFLFAIVVAGLVEEGCKLGCWFLGPARRIGPHADEYETVLQVACISLGFATVENVAYCLRGGYETAWMRAISAVPAHTMFGLVLGIWLGRAQTRKRFGWSSRQLVPVGFLLAVLAHAAYDVLALQGSTPAIVLLGFGLLAGAVWSVSAVRAVRDRSPAWGGTRPRLPAPMQAHAAPTATPTFRDPMQALLLGFVPGLGQRFNGEPRKALLFAILAIVNALMYLAARAFAEDPDGSLRALAAAGITPTLSTSDLPSAVAQRHLLPLLMRFALLAGIGFGALDAWSDARRDTSRARPSYAPHGAVLSYIAHVALALSVMFAPLIARRMDAAENERGAARASSKRSAARPASPSQTDIPMQLTTVVKLDGWKPSGRSAPSAPAPARKTEVPKPAAPAAARPPSPRPNRPKPSTLPRRVAVSTPRAPAPAPRRPPIPPPRIVDVPPPETGGGPSVRREGETLPSTASRTGSTPTRESVGGTSGDGQTARGENGWTSYNQYLSYRFHEGGEADLFFRSVPSEVWVVVRYRIDANGDLVDVEVLETSGNPWQADLVPQLIRRCAPFRALPQGVERITITELFWAHEFLAFPPGSLAESLSRLPDGRLLRE